jgi:hypothetical protein
VCMCVCVVVLYDICRIIGLGCTLWCIAFCVLCSVLDDLGYLSRQVAASINCKGYGSQ